MPMHPLMQLMVAQLENLRRLDDDVILEGTTAAGEQVQLDTPAPELIRLIDTPLHLQQKAERADSPYERILTIAPIRMADAGKIAGRRDSKAAYIIHGLVALTKKEKDEDEAMKYADNPLGRKLMQMAGDVEALIFDDLFLGGIVQDIEAFESTYHVDYPVASFSMSVTCFISGGRC